ncbi:SAM-dependent methyltransferase [Opitutaceae bacterium EW11]|nr:SAM-dependent methyltransferase [Opitutaceae bacterium EW11]
MDTDRWNQRYAVGEYIFGEEPNEFLAAHAEVIPRGGPVLCLAEGEGRNGVHLASLGYAVTGVDASSVGLGKARALADRRGVQLHTVVADLAEYAIAPSSWSGIVSIFFHLPPSLRRRVLAQVVAGLKPGGAFLLEAYTPGQLKYATGGPKEIELLPTLALLEQELAGLKIVHGKELEREVKEGAAHSGRAAVVQVIAVKPE